MKVFHDKHKNSRVHGCISPRGSGDHTWLEGNVYTPHGVVSAYSQGGKNQFSRLSLVINGFSHIFRVHKALTARGLATWAGRVAREIHTSNL